MAEALLERETLTGGETRRLLNGETLPPLDLKTNPRKLITTKDLEKESKDNAEKRVGRRQQRLNKPSSPDGDPSAENDETPDLAPGYDLYGRPNSAEDKAEEEHKREVEEEISEEREEHGQTEESAPKKASARSPLGSLFSDAPDGQKPGEEERDDEPKGPKES